MSLFVDDKKVTDSHHISARFAAKVLIAVESFVLIALPCDWSELRQDDAQDESDCGSPCRNEKAFLRRREEAEADHFEKRDGIVIQRRGSDRKL